LETVANRSSTHGTKFLKPFYPKSRRVLAVRDKLMHEHLLSRFSLVQGLTLLFCMLMITSAMFVWLPTVAASSPQISLGMSSNSYSCMQAAGVYANLTSYGTPIRNGVVAVEVDLSGSSWTPILFRSMTGSQAPASGFFDKYL